MSGHGDDHNMHDADADADADASDDDMDDMDRISSSPSISDGGLPFHSSLTAQEPAQPLSLSCPGSSSPFTEPPVHFPLLVSAAPRPPQVPAGTVPFILSRSPSFSSHTTHPPQSADHHRGEYSRPRTISDTDCANAELDPYPHLGPDADHLAMVENRLQHMRLDSLASLMSESDDGTLSCMLEPVPDPLFGNPPDDDPFYEPDTSSFEIPRRMSSLPRSLDGKADHGDDEDSWTDDSDADTWDATPEKDDDRSTDISFPFSSDSRMVDSGWGGECLREAEDIDFEFVYSLHTFVATVEGQANATKGDTMVLLDDSNSYWVCSQLATQRKFSNALQWLVRVVKDNSIGYLPAEHIETPTERLARLNKHRNIDLSATMLGDTAEKTKNPLKKAMRRRNAKTVQFTQPQYFEPSDYDYSSDEDDGDELFGGADPSQAQAQQQQTAAEKSELERDDGLSVQPLKVNGSKKEHHGRTQAESSDHPDDPTRSGVETHRSSDEIFEKPLDPKVSRNGTMRNTDSFFKDENTETRKITLTPNLLRDDSSTSTTGSRERGPSLESLEKNGFADKVKDDKKKKDKKPGMLSGLFKRKDKKGKGVGMDSMDSDAEPSSKQSEEYGRESPQAKPSDEFSSERTSSEQSGSLARQASKGKLQKPQRGREESPSKVKGILKMDNSEANTAKDSITERPATQTNSTMRIVPAEEEEGGEDIAKSTIEERTPSSEKPSSLNATAAKLNPLNIVKSTQDGEPRPEKVKKAKQRVQLDDFDSDEEKDPFADPDLQAQSAQPDDPELAGRLSESPVHVSVADAQFSNKVNLQGNKGQESDSRTPPGLTGDTSSQETSSPISTPTPEDNPPDSQPGKLNILTTRGMTEREAVEVNPASSLLPPSRPAPVPEKTMDFSPPNSSESSTLPLWSDHSLRTYLDDGSDIRDMLLVINDTTGVVPVGPEHPIMASLFVEETRTVSGLSTQLDKLLSGLLDKREKRNKGLSPVTVVTGR